MKSAHETMLTQVANARRYRSCATAEDLAANPFCVCCLPGQGKNAAQHFESAFGIQIVRISYVHWPKAYSAEELFAGLDSRSGAPSGKKPEPGPVRKLLRNVFGNVKGATKNGGQPPELEGVEVVAPTDLRALDPCRIVVYDDRGRERSIGRMLAILGVHDFLFAADPKCPVSPIPDSYIDDYARDLEAVYALLEDEESRLCFAGVLRHRTTKDSGYLRISPYKEYFHPVVRPARGDVVVDGGGFDGQTSLAFANALAGEGKVYCFEPDQENAVKIAETLQSPKAEEFGGIIEHVALGLGDRRYEVHMEGAGGSARLKGIFPPGTMAPGGAEPIRVTDLDSWAADGKIAQIDVVSLDIEGMELPALKGMEQVIRRCRPKLQISLYHKTPDLTEIPLWIHGLGLGYKFFLGHHDTIMVETDLYAYCP